MRERLNLRCAAAVLAAMMAAAGGVALTHRWQARRHATGLLELADAAEAKGRPDRAVWLLGSYLQTAPGDTATRARYGMLAEGMARDPKSRRGVIDVYERVVTELPDRADIRLRLVRLQMGDGRYPDAAAHLAALNAEAGTDPEAVHLLAECQQARGEVAAAVKTYRRAIELEPGRADHYVRVAYLLRQTGGAAEAAEADQLVDRMVAASPRNARALLSRARYGIKYRTGNPTSDLAAAVELAPADVEVRYTAAAAAKSPDEARNHLRTAIDGQPGDERLYVALAGVEAAAGNRGEATTTLRRGLVRLPGNASLLFALADVLIDAGNSVEAERVLAEIGRWKHSPERVTLLRGRLRMAEGNWQAARAEFEAVRPALAVASRELTADADSLLGRCHEQLGESDLALAAYRRAASVDPARADVRGGIARTLVALGRLGEAIEHYRPLAAAPNADAGLRLMYARLRTLEYISTPVGRRRPTDLDPVFSQAAEKARESLELLLLQVERLAADGKLDAAEKLLRDALASKPNAETGLPLARLLHRHGKVNEAWAVLDALDRATGASIETALGRLDLVPSNDHPRRAPAVQAVDHFRTSASPDDRLRICSALAEANLRWRNAGEARRWYLEVAGLRPHDLSVRLRLLDVAVQAGDRPQMEEAVREIRRVEGDKGAFGHYAEAVLRMARPQDRSAAGLREARQHLSAAALSRPAWAAVPVSLAVLTELEGKPDEALGDYLRAVDLGERRPAVIRRAVQLLCGRRRFAEADRLLQKLGPGSASAELNRLAAEVSISNAQPDRAVELALDAVASESKQYEEHLWQAEILAAAGRKDEALAAFHRAVEVAGPHAAPWVALVRYHVRNDRKDKGEEAFAELGRRLSGPELQLAVAQCHEALGRTEQAEEAYRKAVEARPDDGEALRQLFAFHDRGGTSAKSIPALRRGLAAQPSLPPADVAWARRALAMALAVTGDYDAFQEAMRLADQALAATPDGQDELLTKARVLATRTHQRRAALKIMQDLRAKKSLGPAEEFFLGQLYTDVGAWNEGRAVLVNLVSREGDNPTYLRFLTDRLMRNGQTSESEAWLTRLERVAPSDLATIRLRGLYHIKRGEFRDAAAHLKLAARSSDPPRPDTDVQLVRAVAQVADELSREGGANVSLAPVAETLYRAAAKGGTDDELALASFLGRCGKAEEAIKVARGAGARAGAAAVASVLVAAAYGTPPLSGSQLDILEAEAKAYMANAKPSPEVTFTSGLLHARRGRYAEAAAAFRTVVEATSYSPGAVNNLAYMLVLANARQDEVNSLLEKAFVRTGPIAGLLDIRGMMHLAAGRTAEAAADFEQAVDQNPSAAKCLHLAVAYQKLGRTKDGVRLLARAESLRADGSLVIPAEQMSFEALSRELKQR